MRSVKATEDQRLKVNQEKFQEIKKPTQGMKQNFVEKGQ